LLPGRRKAEEIEMAAEFEALKGIAPARELGNLTLAAENARAVWGWAWLESFAADLRYGMRTLAKQPSFTLAFETEPRQARAAPQGTPDNPVERGVSLSGAVQEQLGLKLDPTKSPVELLVIDRLERAPSEN
jgi:hypothetical protein